jgi:hypothetical protein
VHKVKIAVISQDRANLINLLGTDAGLLQQLTDFIDAAAVLLLAIGVLVAAKTPAQ